MANDKDPVFCAADIIKRAKLAKEFKTDSELAAFLGISRSTLSNWNARNSIDFPLLLGSLDDGLQLAADGKGLACTSFKIL